MSLERLAKHIRAILHWLWNLTIATKQLSWYQRFCIMNSILCLLNVVLLILKIDSHTAHGMVYIGFSILYLLIVMFGGRH